MRRRRLDSELETELTHHFDALVGQYESRGLTPGDARAAARRDMGGLTQVREAYRDQHGLRAVKTLWQMCATPSGALMSGTAPARAAAEDPAVRP